MDQGNGHSTDGSGVQAGEVTYQGEGAQLRGFLAAPSGTGPLPGVLAIHSNWGLHEHFREVACRLAAEGYVVLAHDLLSRLGGTGQFNKREDVTAAIYEKTEFEQNVRDLMAAFAFLRSQPNIDTDRLGVTGWCMGGTYSWQVAIQAGEGLRAACPWYGKNPKPEAMPSIKAAVFAIYAEHDEHINATNDVTAQRMRELGKDFTSKTYPGTNHAFFNDRNPEVYHAEGSRQAWADLLAFFRQHVGSQAEGGARRRAETTAADVGG